MPISIYAVYLDPWRCPHEQTFKQLAEPDDLVAVLASSDARWITGDTIHVDGGSKP
jgi:NAD(P)-dependent dehydrogenase (short-subunit alcohol dehydrogenase family)